MSVKPFKEPDLGCSHADALVQEVDVHTLRDRLDHVRTIDVRDASELAGPLGRIRQAEHVPLGSLAAEAAHWNRGQAIAVVCRSGSRSRQAVLLLQQLGFSNVVNVAGGMTAWNAAALSSEHAR